jgi:hypothetical protein
MSIGKLKKFIDKEIGENWYICVYNRISQILCEGIVSDLRTRALWQLLDEENTDVVRSFSGTSENGKKAIIIILQLYPSI